MSDGLYIEPRGWCVEIPESLREIRFTVPERREKIKSRKGLRDGRDEEDDTVRWKEGKEIPTTSFSQSDVRKMAPRSACACACVCVSACVFFVTWGRPCCSTLCARLLLPSSSSSSCLSVVGLNLSPRAKKDSCFTGVSVSRPPTFTVTPTPPHLHPPLSLYTGKAVYIVLL